MCCQEAVIQYSSNKGTLLLGRNDPSESTMREHHASDPPLTQMVLQNYVPELVLKSVRFIAHCNLRQSLGSRDLCQLSNTIDMIRVPAIRFRESS